MKKLFDIPIYALSPDELSRRVKQKVDKLKECAAGTDLQTMDLIIDAETFPKRCWDYNHVVGYIRISASQQDIVFDLFLPRPVVERYIWNSPRKTFLYDVNPNGTHFYTGNMRNMFFAFLNENVECRVMVRDIELFRGCRLTIIPKTGPPSKCFEGGPVFIKRYLYYFTSQNCIVTAGPYTR